MATSRDTENILPDSSLPTDGNGNKTERVNLDDFVMFLDKCNANFSLQDAII